MRLSIVSFVVFVFSNALNAQVSDGEYFFDIDPGFGKGQSIKNESGLEEFSFTLNTASLKDGIHIGYVRFRKNQVWSQTTSFPFFSHSLNNNSSITALEWFLDIDPGVGKASKLSASVTDDKTNLTFPLEGAQPGVHVLGIRLLNTDGLYSLTRNSVFVVVGKLMLPSIIRMEYFFNTDPGFGEGNNIPIEGSDSVTGPFQLNIDGLSEGTQTVYLRAQDSNGNWSMLVNETFIIKANVPPSGVAIKNVSINENASINTVVGEFESVDSNINDTHTYTLVSGIGDVDNAAFKVEGNKLFPNQVFDFESKSEFNIRVRSTDSGGLFIEQEFTIVIIDVNEAATELNLSSTDIAENQPEGSLIGTLTTADPDSNDTHTYALINGVGDSDNGSFIIEGNELKTNAVFDFETQNTFSVLVAATDAGGLVISRALTINLSNLEEPNITLSGDISFEPTALQLTNTASFTISNNNDDGALVVTSISLPTGFSVSQSTFTIQENDSKEIQVIFSPSVQQTYSGDLTVSSNAGDAVIRITGDGAIITGIDDGFLKAEDISFFPNPTSNSFGLKLPKFIQGEIRLSLISINGGEATVFEYSSKELIEIDVSSYDPGIYLIKVVTDNFEVVKKLIINK